MSRRNTKRIDYREFHSTGRLTSRRSSVDKADDLPTVDKSENLVSDIPGDEKPGRLTVNLLDKENLSSQLANLSLQDNIIMTTNQSDVIVEITVMTEEVTDIIDENPIKGCINTELDSTMSKLESLRSDLRRKHLTSNLDTDHHLTDIVNYTLSSIKEYIKAAKDYKSKLHLSQVKQIAEAAAGKERSTIFVIEDIQQNLAEIEQFVTQSLRKVDDHQLLQIKNDAHYISNRLDKISPKYEKLLQSPITHADSLHAVKNIGVRYVKLCSLKTNFTSSVNEEYHRRELDKQQSNKHINIKLDKFCGYESTVDFYTFRSNFDKTYLSTTPSRYLPDLLKNNFLGEPALSLVRSIDNINDIWTRLKTAYGDTKVMLTKKLQVLSKSDITRSRDPEKLVYALSKFTNLVREVMLLAKQHGIEEKLYYGDALLRIYQQLGDGRLTRFLSSIADDEPTEKQTWERLLTFLEKEEKLNQQKVTIQCPRNERRDAPSTHSANATKPTWNRKKHESSYHSNQPTDPHCQLCGESPDTSEHVSTNGPGGVPIIQYYTCKEFAEKSPAARLSTLKEKGFCFQCLLPGADATRGKHIEGKCQHDFICPHPSHHKYPVKKHVLVCEEHKQNQSNQEILEKFKSRFMRNSNLPNFSKHIQLAFHTDSYTSHPSLSPKDSATNKGIYLLQTITVNGNKLTVFFDNGCSDFILSSNAVKLLGPMAKKFSSEPTNCGGVGKTVTTSSGSYNVTLPLHDGKTVHFSGICLEKISSDFPMYPLKEVEKDIFQDYQSNGGSQRLPQLPSAVGGEIHLMIGVKYLRYHPKQVYQLCSGLTLYESQFQNSEGGCGVVGGPHRKFTEVHNSFIMRNPPCNATLLGYSDTKSMLGDFSTQANVSSQQRLFEKVESTGSEISYRCPTCRACKDCKHHDEYESISLKEEVEQDLINSSVTLNPEHATTSAHLPFISSPNRLANNKDRAMKVYNQQLRKLNLPINAKDKEDIIDSERKLHQLGFVDYTHNLPSDVQLSLQNNPVQHYIPWRAVWKGNSVSTPCRIVFDASQATSSGYSLNDLLAKGRNNLNKLQEIVIRWSMYHVGIHTDIKKMYNTIKLDQADWCYQRYIWEENLDASKIPQEKIIKTLIYGVRSSGNQAEYGLRKVAELSSQEYPSVNEVVKDDTYVDDCITGEHNPSSARKLADDIEVVLNRGGFQLKGVCFSGEKPLESLTDDGNTIHVAGMKWFPLEDTLSLNIGELNFAKKCRGKKPLSTVNIIPERLTRRHCASKVAEVFDLTGKVTPLVAAMKMDLQELVRRKLDWDDAIPEDLRLLWKSHFNMIQEIGNLRFQRAIIPQDAVSLEIQTLDFGDASQTMVCSCIYARFKKKTGNYSCQLVLSRSRVVPKGMSLPRAELYAALLNAYTGEVVRRSFKKHHKHAFKFTDSQISLFWITNDQKPLRQWVRNRVIEIQRFTTKDQWYYIKSSNMLADIGTRKGATINDVCQDSLWINGHPWMLLDHSEFPMSKPDKLSLNNLESDEIKKEVESHVSKISDEVRNRNAFSDYIIDPNRFSFSKVVRILGYVIRFCRQITHVVRSHQKLQCQSQESREDDLKKSEEYFFRCGTREIHQFVQPSKFQKFTTQRDGILIYTGRILPSDEVSIVGKFTSVMKDLSSDTFCVPVLDKDSPIAYSIALDVHWNHPVCKHSGVETTLRYIMKKVYIIEGRSLVKLIRKSCQRCRFLLKKSVEAAMGPISESNLMIAPAFYASQVDLSGPYFAFSPSRERTTVKIWLTVFCCCTTSAVSIKVMDDYSTDAFIQSFTRFACNNGYPKKLFCDAGSQILSGCNNMKLDFKDIQSRLHLSKAVEFSVCPVGGHNMNGKVERKIKEINLSIEKNINNQRLSLLQWETLSSVIANSINDLPISVGSKVDVENMDLLTPNRLLLGRNNDRSPIGDMVLMNKPSKLLRENEKIFNAWFESWLLNHVPKLMDQSKWYGGDSNVQVGDVVLFKKCDSVISKTYQYGIISSVECGKDGVIRKVRVQYRNANENTDRETYRSVRELVLIRSTDELDVMEELALKSEC